MRKIVSILLLSVISFSVLAQVPVKPGDKLINYEWLKPNHDFYRNQIRDTSGKLIYDFVMEDFTTIDSAKKQIVFARSRQVPPGSFSTDTSITDLHFKPIWMHEIHYQGNVSFDMNFADEKAVVKTTQKGVATERTYLMKRGYFEDNMIEYIFGYLTLKKETTYILDNFNKDTPAPSDPYLLEYSFDDTWNTAPDHNINCIVLKYTHGDTSGYIWIDKSTHLMIKTIAKFKTGTYLITKI